MELPFGKKGKGKGRKGGDERGGEGRQEKGSRKHYWSEVENEVQCDLNTVLSPGISEDVMIIQGCPSSSEKVGPLHIPAFSQSLQTRNSGKGIRP